MSEAAASLLATAQSFRARRNLGGARAACQAALATAPGLLSALRLLGSIEGEAGITSASVRLLRRLLHHAPQDADGYVNLGGALLESGARPAALRALRRALCLRPDQADAFYNSGLAHHRSGRLDAAATAYRRAVASHPRHFEARRNLAVALHLGGQVETAVATLRRLVEEAPERLDVADNLALALLDEGSTLEAARLFVQSALRRHGLGEAAGFVRPDVTPTKLKHDAEQLDYLLARDRAPRVLSALRDLYKRLLAGVPAGTPPAQPLKVDGKDGREIETWFGRHYLRNDPPTRPAGALNPALDWRRIEQGYLDGRPEISVVDGLLHPDALAALRDFCMESSFWGRSYGGGYLGAFMEDGFFCPLLAQIADELRARLPRILRDHPLKKVWGFKYDSSLSGINLHADFAAVNVNFWITPDEANLDPRCGGLVVWDKGAPADWSFETYNRSPDRSRAFLAEAGARPVVIPYAANRAVFFNSNLFHETDRIAFRDGYANRRVNVTLLYGNRS